MAARVTACVFATSLVSILADVTWTPKDSMLALDSALQAVKRVSSLPDMSPEHAGQVVQLVQDLSRDIQDGERGSLTAAHAYDKLGTAIMTLTSLEHQSALSMQKTGTKRQAVVLRHRDVEKHVAVDTTVEKLKLQKLEDKLLKKKLALENLINSCALLKLTPEDLVERQAFIDSLNATATLLSDDGHKTLSGQEKEQKIQTMLAKLHAEQNHTRLGLDKLKELEDLTAKEFAILENADSSLEDDEQVLAAGMNSTEKQLNDSNHSIPSNHSDQTASASQEGQSTPGSSMLKYFKASKLRQATKMELRLQSDLRNLKEAEASIRKRDVTGLKAIVTKMRTEANLLRPTSVNFIY